MARTKLSEANKGKKKAAPAKSAPARAASGAKMKPAVSKKQQAQKYKLQYSDEEEEEAAEEMEEEEEEDKEEEEQIRKAQRPVQPHSRKSQPAARKRGHDEEEEDEEEGEEEEEEEDASNKRKKSKAASSAAASAATRRVVRSRRITPFTRKKWKPLADSTRTFVDRILESAMAIALNGVKQGAYRTETHELMVKAKGKIERRLDKCVAPKANLRLTYGRLADNNKEMEEQLLSCQRQIVALEKELAEQTARQAEDLGQLEEYEKNLAAHESFNKKQQTILHPLLRKSGKAPGARPAKEDAQVPKEALSTGSALAALGAADPEVAVLQGSLHTKLSAISQGLEPLKAYLHAVHGLADVLHVHPRDDDEAGEAREGGVPTFG